MSHFSDSTASAPASSVKFSEKTLFDFCADIWRARYFVSVGLVIAMILAGIFMIVAVPHYKAQMIISPARPMSGIESASILKDDNLLALRSLARNAGFSDSAEFTHFEHIYAGPVIAAQLLKDPVIIKGLELDRAFQKFGKVKNAQTWSPVRLSEYVARRVRLEPVKATALKRLTYRHPSPEFAVYFVQKIHDLADEHIRNHTQAMAGERIAYLQETVAKARNPDHRRALTTLLLEQERLRMLASIDQPYAAEIIEPATSSFKAVWPAVPLVFLLFMASGSFFGFLLHSLYVFVQTSRAKAAPASNFDPRWCKMESGNNNEKPRTGGRILSRSADHWTKS